MIAQTIHERREQFHSLRLGEYLDPLNPTVNAFLIRHSPTCFSSAAIPLLPGRWHCNCSTTCARNKPPRSPTSISSSSLGRSPSSRSTGVHDEAFCCRKRGRMLRPRNWSSLDEKRRVELNHRGRLPRWPGFKSTCSAPGSLRRLFQLDPIANGPSWFLKRSTLQ